jgi:transketolase
MLNKLQKLNPKLFDADVEQRPNRDGYGTGVLIAGEKDERVVVLCADLTESTRSEGFAKKFPERFIELGVAEQNLATVAAGMANYGKIPFISSYAMFSPGRNWEQIRTTICYNDVPVKIVGAHAGVSVGPDGATHQALEDVALMRVLPNMTVLVPCDALEAERATIAAAKTGKPVYIRLAREKTPIITSKESRFEIGKAEILWECEGLPAGEAGKPDVAIISTGPVTYYALCAAKELEAQGKKIRVINCHTIKPIDEGVIVTAARDAGKIVTVEEHQVAGGLGSAVAEVLARHYPVPMEFVGVKDEFGQSGKPEELIAHYGIDTKAIIKAVENF